MTKKLIFWILACFVLSTLIVVILFAASQHIRQKPGSFIRQFPPHPAIEGKVLNLEYNSYYIAGGTSHHIYLANYAAPLHLIEADNTLADTQHVKLDVRGIADQKFWAAHIEVDSPYYYLTDGVVPIIYRGTIDHWQAEKYMHCNAYFQDIAPLSNESFFIRALSNPGRENTLGKISTAFPHVRMRDGILQKQVDGIFCTDGMMHYSKTEKQLIYLYRYRNEYIIMDTSLNILRKGNTIDNTTKAQIAIAKIKSSASTTFASPPLMVNKHSSVSSNQLFVQSMLMAKNENPESLVSASVIDVYDLQTGKYRFSFYIHDYQGHEKLEEFTVIGDKLFAIFKTHLQIWHLRMKYFGNTRS
jgi:hypothetical protein